MRKIEKGYAYNIDGAADTIFPDLKIVKLFKQKYMFSL